MIIQKTLARQATDLKPGLYPLTNAVNLGGVVIKYLKATETKIFLLTDELPAKKVFAVAPIKLDLSEISKADTIPMLVAAFASPVNHDFDADDFFSNFEGLSALDGALPCEVEGNVASFIDGQMVLLTYNGFIASGDGPVVSRKLLLRSIVVRYVPGNMIWPCEDVLKMSFEKTQVGGR